MKKLNPGVDKRDELVFIIPRKNVVQKELVRKLPVIIGTFFTTMNKRIWIFAGDVNNN